MAGRAWHHAGRYGAAIGRSPKNDESLLSAYEQDNDPVDHVKIINSGLNSLECFGRETPPQFDQIEMNRVVQSAARQGRKVMVHANGREPVQMAIAAGHHKKGLGTLLLKRVESMLHDRGFTSIELHARKYAIGFYEKLGYRTIGEECIEVTISHYKMVKNLFELAHLT